MIIPPFSETPIWMSRVPIFSKEHFFAAWQSPHDLLHDSFPVSQNPGSLPAVLVAPWKYTSAPLVFLRCGLWFRKFEGTNFTEIGCIKNSQEMRPDFFGYDLYESPISSWNGRLSTLHFLIDQAERSGHRFAKKTRSSNSTGSTGSEADNRSTKN